MGRSIGFTMSVFKAKTEKSVLGGYIAAVTGWEF
jgi:hypothetical protein